MSVRSPAPAAPFYVPPAAAPPLPAAFPTGQAANATPYHAVSAAPPYPLASMAYGVQCRVCGIMISSLSRACPRCGVPPGMIANPYDPTVTTYLPANAPLPAPPTSLFYDDPAPGIYTPIPSGTGVMPEPGEVAGGWNWAAALNSTIWGLTHRVWIMGLVSCVNLLFWLAVLAGAIAPPHSAHGARGSGSLSDDNAAAIAVMAAVTSLGFWIGKTLYMGRRGNTLAWKSGRYTTPAEMRAAQRQWNAWSIPLFLVCVGLAISVLALGAFR